MKAEDSASQALLLRFYYLSVLIPTKGDELCTLLFTAKYLDQIEVLIWL